MLDTSDSLLKQNKLTLRVATYGGFEVQRENQNYKNYGGNFGGRQVAKNIAVHVKCEVLVAVLMNISISSDMTYRHIRTKASDRHSASIFTVVQEQ